MCGRYAATRRVDDLVVEYEAQLAAGTPPVQPDWNVAPTKPVPVVRQTSSGTREIRVVRWGLVPHWAADERGAARAINARAETVTTRPTFRDAVARHRCLVPADGWYEWRDRRPWYVAPAGGGLAFAGLYAVRGDMWTCTILTTASYGPLADLHARMPRVLPRADWSRWLDRETTVPTDLLEPAPPEVLDRLEARPVNLRVGDHRNNGPELLDPPADVLFS